MGLSSEQQKGIKELVTLVHELCNNSNIPNNARRDLTDSGVRRLMPETMKTTAVRIEELIEQFGYDISTRIAVIEVCKAVGVNVNFVPTEQDSCGWLTAKFTTPKGCFHYG